MIEKFPDNYLDDSKINSHNSNSNWQDLSSIPFSQKETLAPHDNILEAISSTDLTVYERLNATNDKAAKEEFLSNPNLTRPNNEYGNLDQNEVLKNLAALDRIDEEISKADLSRQQKTFFNILSTDCRRKNDFLLANIQYNSTTTPEEKAIASKHHHQANEALYGKADQSVFNVLLQEKLAKINPSTLDPENRKKYDQLMVDLGPLEDIKATRFTPKPETVSRFAELTKDFFENFLKHIPEGKQEFAGADMAQIVNQILEQEFSDEPDPQSTAYKAVVSADASNASVNHETRQIIFPESKTYSRAKAAGIIVHELGVHAMRAILYTDQKMSAFSTGFPDNETWDEGIAKCVEQAIDGKYTDSGIDHYINIGLASFKNKNFREVYEIQHTINDLLNKPSKTLINSVQRCFRGTGELPNNKDLAYYNGATKVWQYIENHLDDPNLFDNLFLVGKLDITNPEQEAISYEKRVNNID